MRHHYDVSNEFFALFLDDSMTYSCALFSRGADTLEEAQEAKLELVCRKLALQRGRARARRRLRLGQLRDPRRRASTACRPSASRSPPPQAELARRRVRRGRASTTGSRSAYATTATWARRRALRRDRQHRHGRARRLEPASTSTRARSRGLLEPGGRLLNHGIARLRHGDAEAGPFSERYVFPDAAPLHLSRVQLALERAGFETDHVEGLRQDYVDTLSAWIDRLDANLEAADRLAGGERMRVWRLYLRAPQRLRDGLHLDLPGARPPLLAADAGGDRQDAGDARRRTRRTGRRGRWPREVGLTQTAVSRIWRAFGLQPHRQETWKLSKDPQFVDKVRDVVGLYLDPPERAVVLCVDEKSQIQALDRTAPILPMLPGTPERATHDYKRSGHLEPLRRAGHHDRQGDRLAARPPPRDRVQEVPADARPRGPRRARRAPDPRQRLHPQDAGDQDAGCSPTPASSCTSPRPRAPG